MRTNVLQLTLSGEPAGPSPAPRAHARQTDALLQLQSQAAHAKSKFPVEAGTFDQLVAEDIAFANKKDKPNVIDSRGLEGKRLKFAASRLRSTDITHCKAQTGAAQGSWPSTPSTFGKEKISVRSYCGPRVLLTLLQEGAAAERRCLSNQGRAAGPSPWLTMLSCSTGASLASHPSHQAALPKQTFMSGIFLISSLFLGEDTGIITFSCIFY